MDKITQTNYTETLNQIKSRIYAAQHQALKSVNRQLIELYWDIGKTIVEKQEEEGWGKSTVERLSKDLRIEFPGIRGFSVQNLWRMRTLYQSYDQNPKLAPLAREIGWSHNILIIEKCKDPLRREFYLRMTIREGWSKRTLQAKIKSQAYERWALKQDNFEETLPETLAKKGQLIVKDDYNFDFLMLREEHKERELEDELVKNIVQFLSSLGGDFAFVGRQYKIEFEEEEYYIDLLFFNRRIKSLVAIDLKTGEFQPEYAGKMQFYLSLLDDHERMEGENPSVGIIICGKKNRKKVEYTLRYVVKPIGVATYNQYSKLEDLPKQIAEFLPSEDEITRRLGHSIIISREKN